MVKHVDIVTDKEEETLSDAMKCTNQACPTSKLEARIGNRPIRHCSHWDEMEDVGRDYY
jgi:hypothetical protein